MNQLDESQVLQLSTKVSAQSPSISIYIINAACGSTVLIINLVSGLIYFDLTENECLVNMNKEM